MCWNELWTRHMSFRERSMWKSAYWNVKISTSLQYFFYFSYTQYIGERIVIVKRDISKFLSICFWNPWIWKRSMYERLAHTFPPHNRHTRQHICIVLSRILVTLPIINWFSIRWIYLLDVHQSQIQIIITLQKITGTITHKVESSTLQLLDAPGTNSVI
jgi:hypothetical protein